MEIADLGSSSEKSMWVLTSYFLLSNGDVTCPGCSTDNSGDGKVLIVIVIIIIITKAMIANISFMLILFSPQL